MIDSISIRFSDGTSRTFTHDASAPVVVAPAVPASTPSPIVVVPPSVLTPPVATPTTRAEAHKTNMRQYFAEGSRGRVLAVFYIDRTGYKSLLQDWIKTELLPSAGLDYAHWTDPMSYAGADAHATNDAEWLVMLSRLQGVVALPE